MLNFFRRDPLAKTDRRKQRAEKREMRFREKIWRQKRRTESWLRFKKRMKEFLDAPFAKRKVNSENYTGRIHMIFARDPYAKIDRQKQKAERKYMLAKKKEWRRRHQAETRKNFEKHLIRIFSNPFKKGELTEDQIERREISKRRKFDRKIYRQKLWIKFKKSPLKVIFPKRKIKTEDGGYLYVYHMTRQERKELKRLKRKQDRDTLNKIFTTPDLRWKFIFVFLHSVAYFILAFILIYIIYQAITIVVASSFRIPVVWYYYELKFPLYTYSPLYTRAALVSIFAAGPIVSLMLALVFLKLFFTTHPFLKRFQLFFLWGFVCGINMFFGAYIAGFFTRTEFIYTSEWLFMSNVFDIEEIFFTAISVVMMVVVGRIATPLFLLASGSVTLVKPEFRLFLIFSEVIFPWMAGILILFLFTTPNYYFPLVIKTFTPGLILIPSLFLYNSLQYEDIHKTGVIQHNYFRWSVVIAAIAILFFYRIILSFGLRIS